MAHRQILKPIRGRWSPREFSDQKIEKEELEDLFEAARWAASSFNEQPWRYLVGMRGEGSGYENLLSCLFEGNAAWASQAPVLILACCSKAFARNNKPNRHASYDLGQSVATLSLEAAHREIYLHQMAGFDQDKARASFSIPDTFDPMAIMAMGKLPQGLAQPEGRQRRPLEECLFYDEWGVS